MLQVWLKQVKARYSPAHGDTAFTVPLFGNFLRRVMPVPAYRKTKENS
jgi:hypothetical protein